jgi:UDP-N-acetylmuramate dehydrogenase
MTDLLHKALAGISVREHVPLASLSTLKVGGHTPFLLMPKSDDEIARVQNFAAENDMALHVVSGGSNTLFSDDGFPGLIVKLAPTYDSIAADEKNLALSVGAATSFAKVTKLACSWGMTRALGWCGTPGLIGGAARMNAGTRMGEIKDAITRVHGLLHGKEICFLKDQIEFAYRKTSLPRDLIITRVDLAAGELVEDRDELNTKVQEYRRRRRQTQPSINSLGSFFKNPYPHFAAQLIEKCNLKGLEYRGAQISPLHANFIVNNGGASADDILYIASIAQQRVFDQFGIVLSPEVRMVGSFRRDLPLTAQASTTSSMHNVTG